MTPSLLLTGNNDSDLNPRTDVVVLPETFLPALPRYRPLACRNCCSIKTVLTVLAASRRRWISQEQLRISVLNLYSHHDVSHVLCVSQHDQQLLVSRIRIGPQRVSRLINAIETMFFNLVRKKASSFVHASKE